MAAAVAVAALEWMAKCERGQGDKGKRLSHSCALRVCKVG